MKFTTRILLIMIAAVLLTVLAYQGYLTVRFRLHNGHEGIISVHTPPVETFEFTSPDANASDVPGMVFAAESTQLRLYVEESTGNIALFDKRSGVVIYSVHPDMKEDPLASDLNRSLLQSQITVDFFTPNRTPVRWNSFDHAVSHNQVKLRSLENGLRVIYTIGDISSPTGIVPVYIPLERLEALLAPIEGTRDYNRNFLRYVESDAAEGYMELIPAARTGAATLRDMNELFESLGYTAEDYAADMAGSGVEDAVALHFIIPIDFTLDGSSLIVNIDTAEIGEYAGGRINMIQIMRGFGAGGIDEEGYIVIPNGSGSLINFNNGKTNADEYMQYIYGQDPMMADYLTLGNIEEPRIPFFGIQGGNRTILGRIESGESQAYLTAGISGKFNSYNYVYPGFLLRGSLSLAMFGSTGNEAQMPVVEREMPMLNLSVRYTMPEETGYSAMANEARRQLVEEGILHEDTPAAVGYGQDIPFYMDLIGSTMGRKFFAGIRYMGQIPMTDYAQARQISEDLAGRGITHQIINYQGWYNRGYYHDAVSKINPVRQLGNIKELEALARRVENMGGRFYSDVNLIGVPFSSKRFNWQMESSRYYAAGMVGFWGMVNPITFYNTFSSGYPELMHNALSPRFLTRYMDSYIKESSRYNLTGTSLRDMGSTLVSDRRRTGVIHRQQAKEVVEYNMENLSAQGKPIMITGGNMYALRYARDLINMPLSHNALFIADEEIPFYQMIVHGYINYAGNPINLSGALDIHQVILRLVEYGASPHFTFTFEDSGRMKYTALNRMYSTRYNNWRDIAETVYYGVNEALSHVSGTQMINHEILQNGLRITTYSNGVKIIVNRSSAEQSYEGQSVPATGYIVLET